MKPLYAEVIVDIAHANVDRSFSYRIPAALQARLQIGDEVRVPFGSGNRTRSGYVVAISDHTAFAPEAVKEIAGIAENRESIEHRQMELAFWMHEHYGCTIFRALNCVLPVKNKVRPKQKRRLILRADEAKAAALLAKYREKHMPARARVLQYLMEVQEADLDVLRKELKVSMPSVTALAEDGAAEISESEVNRITLPEHPVRQPVISLSEEQQAAVQAILQRRQQKDLRPSLIYGITGSGKTELYMELIAQVLEEGRQAIVLIPEIALTYQTVSRFVARFGNAVSMLNSRMSAGERYDQFERAKRGEIRVMIGPRSALFTPFPDLGLVVMDEEHEATYKNENQPRYHARETAQKLCEMCGAMLVLGSATPSLEAFYAAEQNKVVLYRLTKRANDAQLPEVLVADMRKELERGNRTMFSDTLRGALAETLARKEQAMLFINRRGYSGFVSCRSCGTALKCPHCDVSLSLHQDNMLRCHYCGYSVRMVKHCPVCGSGYIGAFKAGTQQIVKSLGQLFPEAKVVRMDYDTTKNKGEYEAILKTFADHDADIMVGTQMIVKGHDFPKVTLMGILAADASLFVPDFRAAERSFQLLTQAAGRAGRAERPGKVVIQTYQPEHYAVRYAAEQDYEGFYREEMQYRRLLGYPPASHLMVIMTAAKNQEEAKQTAERIKTQAAALCDGETMILGPSPASIEKLKDYYRQMIYIRKQEKRALETLRDRIDGWLKESEFLSNCIVQYDIDPVQLQ